MVVPLAHHRNLVECDEDEWEELRNFQKSLTRYYGSLGKGVIFYETAIKPTAHAALVAIPLAHHLVDTAPAYFKEAILAADEQWSQHRPLISTLDEGKGAFRKSMPATLPYFHVWFNLDGGMGHVVEDEGKWPRGDLFAREVVGGMLGVGGEVVRKQGRWGAGTEKGRVEKFRGGWGKWDWTRVLVQEGS